MEQTPVDQNVTVYLRIVALFKIWLPLYGIYLAFTIGNLLLPTAFWEMSGNSWLEFGAMFCNGALASEIAILGIWMAFSTEPIRYPALLCV